MEKATPGGVISPTPPATTLVVAFKFTDGSTWNMPLDDVIDAMVRQSKAVAVMSAQIERAKKANPAVRRAKAQQQDKNIGKVRRALKKLPVHLEGRNETAWLVEKTGLSDKTVRKHVAAIRAETKPE